MFHASEMQAIRNSDNIALLEAHKMMYIRRTVEIDRCLHVLSIERRDDLIVKDFVEKLIKYNTPDANDDVPALRVVCDMEDETVNVSMDDETTATASTTTTLNLRFNRMHM